MIALLVLFIIVKGNGSINDEKIWTFCHVIRWSEVEYTCIYTTLLQTRLLFTARLRNALKTFKHRKKYTVSKASVLSAQLNNDVQYVTCKEYINTWINIFLMSVWLISPWRITHG